MTIYSNDPYNIYITHILKLFLKPIKSFFIYTQKRLITIKKVFINVLYTYVKMVIKKKKALKRNTGKVPKSLWIRKKGEKDLAQI